MTRANDILYDKMAENNLIKEYEKQLLDKSQTITQRMRALFALRCIETDEAALAICKAMYDDSELLAHEAAYCLGQQKQKISIPYLEAVLSNVSISSVVRHEAAEALGAIGDDSSLNLLSNFLFDPYREVADTCRLAIDRIKYYKPVTCIAPLVDPIYDTTDPAPAHHISEIKELEAILLDENQSLFERYRSMFALRNLKTDDSIDALVKGFTCSGALFKHEIAFVLGQMRHVRAANSLMSMIEKEYEHPMVRHECAEALGNIATDECISYLKTRANDKVRIVKESCIVALDIASYQNSQDFEYIAA